MSDPTIPFDVQPSVNNHFAWLRTVMGLERTLMAAVRTSMSLIGFGFTVAQFLSGYSAASRWTCDA
jgi:putative membrane protein